MGFWLAATIAVAAAPAKAPFEYPIYLTVGPDRSIYVADQNLPGVIRITPDGKAVTLFKGQQKYRTELYRARPVALDGKGTLLVGDPATMDVYRLGGDGKPAPLTGKPVKHLNGMTANVGEFIIPEGLAVGADGTIYVADLRYATIFKVAPGSNKPAKLAEVPAPHGMALDRDGTLVVVSHGESNLVRVRADTGAVTNILAGRLPNRKYVPFPLSVCVRPDGNYVVTDNYNRCLWLVTRDGKADVLVEGDPLKKCTGVASDSAGNLAIADPASQKIYWLSPDKKFSVAAER